MIVSFESCWIPNNQLVSPMALTRYSKWLLHIYSKSIFANINKDLEQICQKIGKSVLAGLPIVLKLNSKPSFHTCPVGGEWKRPLFHVSTSLKSLWLPPPPPHSGVKMSQQLSQKKFGSFWIVADKCGRKKKGLVQLRVKSGVDASAGVKTQACCIFMVSSK